MGNEERKEMLFWTKEEYLKFAEEMMDKPVSYYAFQMLYWTGIREGELLALTPADFDFEKGTVSISKSYQRMLLDGMRVAYSGVPGAFAHIAATRIFDSANAIAYDSFKTECNNGIGKITRRYFFKKKRYSC